MKGYYICTQEYDFTQPGVKPSGIDRKIMNHVETFNEAGLNCELKIAVRHKGGIVNKVVTRLPFGTDFVDWPDPASLADADWFYIRRPYLTSHRFMRFLKEIRRLCPKAKILYEIPTYPYDQEMEGMGWMYRPWLWKDRFHRVHFKRYVDRIVSVTYETDELWGAPVINIKNGIRLKDVPLRQPRDGDGTIRIVCAAAFSRYHGVDRLLRGMEEYHEKGGKRKIELHLAGKGQALPELQKMIEQSDYLKSAVKYWGMLDAKELAALYDLCDLGFANLRSGLQVSSALKTRELMAAGIPFFGDAEIDILQGAEVDYFIKMPVGETPIEIPVLIDFYDGLFPQDSCREKTAVAQRMRAFAGEKIDMGQVFRPVIEYLR